MSLVAAQLIGVQVRLEEQHLARLHGEPYRAWAARVGRFVPGVGVLRWLVSARAGRTLPTMRFTLPHDSAVEGLALAGLFAMTLLVVFLLVTLARVAP